MPRDDENYRRAPLSHASSSELGEPELCYRLAAWVAGWASGAAIAMRSGGGAKALRELVRTNDAVVISAIEALLDGAGIGHLVVDQNMSVLEGSIGIFPRRILVGEDELTAARRLLAEAGFEKELRQDDR
jgi:hypothetical protein